MKNSMKIERDVDAELKDKEVMEDSLEEDKYPASQDIPPSNPDQLWHHLSPKNIQNASQKTLLQAHFIFKALEGYGISETLFKRLPEDIQALFNEDLMTNEHWNPEDHI